MISITCLKQNNFKHRLLSDRCSRWCNIYKSELIMSLKTDFLLTNWPITVVASSIFYYYSWWSETVHSVLWPLLAYCTSPRWWMMVIVEQLVGWRLAGETEVLGENLPSATLSATKPTWPDPSSNPGRRGGKPAANRLSYGSTLAT
jgi:hypothetical protein